MKWPSLTAKIGKLRKTKFDRIGSWMREEKRAKTKSKLSVILFAYDLKRPANIYNEKVTKYNHMQCHKRMKQMTARLKV